jgi:hypothetical protein
MPTGEPGSGGSVDHPDRPRNPPLGRVFVAPVFGFRPRVIDGRADGEDAERCEHRQAKRVLLGWLRSGLGEDREL